MRTTFRPGHVRDAIVCFLQQRQGTATVAEIRQGVEQQIGPAPASSVRSSLRLHTGDLFERIGRGRYKLR